MRLLNKFSDPDALLQQGDLSDPDQARDLHDAQRLRRRRETSTGQITIEYQGRALEHTVYRQQEQHQAKVVPPKLLQPAAAHAASQPQQKRGRVPMSHPWRSFEFTKNSLQAKELRGELCITA